MSLLAVTDLSVRFHTHAGTIHAVRNVSLSLDRGEVLAIVGESGSGKSVTAQAILGLVPTPPGEIAGGSITFRGTELAGASEAELARIRGVGISMIFQDPMSSLNPSMRIGRQIAEVIERHDPGADARKRTLDLLRLVGITDVERRFDQYPHQFSGGMRQRIMIAMALAMDPDVLLADEPTTALDVTIQSQIFRLIRDLRLRLGTAMVLITHDLGLVAGIADRIAVMYAGRVVEEGTTDQIFYDPQHPYTVGLLSAVPRAGDAADAPLRTIEGLPPVVLDPRPACAFAPRCPHAMRICRQADPPEFRPRPANRTACWLHHEHAQIHRERFLAGRSR